jgi:hypothetical protein
MMPGMLALESEPKSGRQRELQQRIVLAEKHMAERQKALDDVAKAVKVDKGNISWGQKLCLKTESQDFAEFFKLGDWVRCSQDGE